MQGTGALSPGFVTTFLCLLAGKCAYRYRFPKFLNRWFYAKWCPSLQVQENVFMVDLSRMSTMEKSPVNTSSLNFSNEGFRWVGMSLAVV